MGPCYHEGVEAKKKDGSSTVRGLSRIRVTGPEQPTAIDKDKWLFNVSHEPKARESRLPADEDLDFSHR